MFYTLRPADAYKHTDAVIAYRPLPKLTSTTQKPIVN